jgi:thiol peroxidase
MEKHKGMITFGGNPLTLSGPLTKVGNLAPDFTAINSRPLKSHFSLY